MQTKTLNADRLRDLLNYCPETGDFTWRESRRGVTAGKKTGRALKTGGGYPYIFILIFGKHYRAHRLAFLWMTGNWPIAFVDHKDGNSLNNRWSNLRQASPSENVGNSRRAIHNTTGFKGVHFHKRAQKFTACIWAHGKSHHLGCFNTPEDAHAAYMIAARQHFGEFARAS